MSDKIIRGMACNEAFRFFAVDATQVVKDAASQQKLSITATVLLGRMLVAGLMMGSDLKNETDSLTLKITGDGVLGGALVDCRSDGHIRGYVVQPEVDYPLEKETNSIQVGKAVGQGILTVIKKYGNSAPYQSEVVLQTSEVAEDIAYYYAQSEQIPTAVSLGLLVDPDLSVRRAGGFIVQAMPNTSEEKLDHLESNINRMPFLSDLLDMGLSIEEICAKVLFKNMDINIAGEQSVQYHCTCSKEAFYKGLSLLDISDLEEMRSEPVTTHCRFCNREYTFSRQEITDIMEKKIQEDNKKI
jgi:molecular chaperone Hsp33